MCIHDRRLADSGIIPGLQVLLGFTNFYRRFILKYAMVLAPFSVLLKTQGSSRSEWNRNARLAVQMLNKAFTGSLILQNLIMRNPMFLQTNASGFAITGILIQYDRFEILLLINFYFRECSTTGQNYDTFNWELFGIVKIMKQWRHYLEGANHMVLMQWDHNNVKCFQTAKVLSQR
jgi:hypothetical protein